MTTTERALLEDRKAQALRDLREIERQVASGEVDEATGERLTRVYEADVVRAVEAIEALDRRAAGDDGDGQEATARRWSRRRVVWGTAIMLLAGALVVVAASRAIKPRPPGQFVTGGVAAPGADGEGGVDLSKVTNEQMEEVVRQNPGIVRMRLALARRYIEAEAWDKARDHAHIALQQEPSAENEQEALWVLGWSTVMLGDTATGAGLLQESLDLDPDDPNALFFLAVTKSEVVGDGAGAVPLFERLLARNRDRMTPDEVAVVEQALASARQRAQAPPTTAAPAPGP